MRAVIVVLLAILCLGAANARSLKDQITPPLDKNQTPVGTLSVSEANALADALIESLKTATYFGEATVQGSEAANILAEAIDGRAGAEASAIILTRLSEFVKENGCTAAVRFQIKNSLKTEYQGNTIAMVSALRALDTRTTPVAALGACLQETTAEAAPEESISVKSVEDGN